jgi:hypothetical protein
MVCRGERWEVHESGGREENRFREQRCKYIRGEMTNGYTRRGEMRRDKRGNYERSHEEGRGE